MYSSNVFAFLLLTNIIDYSHSLSALSFLTGRPSKETIQFAIHLAQKIPTVDVFIVVDNNNTTIPLNSSSTVRFLQFNETVCTRYGFRHANIVGTHRNCSAWDKALYYFCRVSTYYSFVWFVEDDVFIPSVQAFLSLHELYSPSYDLVNSDIGYNTNGSLGGWYHWYRIPGTFSLPWAFGMVSAMGCSRRLLAAVSDYAHWRGELAFIEFMFHTLAIHDSKMRIVTPFELDTIVYRTNHQLTQIQARPCNWWHPVKNFTLQNLWRKRSVNTSLVNYKNSFTTLRSMIRQLTSNNLTKLTSDVTKQTKQLLAIFELIKSQIKPSARRQLRNRLLQLATNQSNNITSTIVLLADHAFRLPHRGVDIDTIQNKTIIHMKLEGAIENNKKTVIRLTEFEDLTADEMVIIERLRNETKRLIVELDSEIKCEKKIFFAIKQKFFF